MKVLLLLTSLLLTAGARSGEQPPHGMNPADAPCAFCHVSDTPTRLDPSLRGCPRSAGASSYPAGKSPAEIRFGGKGGPYGPVTFPHKAHAEMAAMGGGCRDCHHYGRPGTAMKCDQCHSKSRAREDLGKPDLRGARHRLCMECHLRWDKAAACGDCHEDKGRAEPRGTGKSGPGKVRVPDRLVYETASEKGRYVTFFHADHSRVFGLKCVDCHRQETCESCHSAYAAERGAVRKAAPAQARHKACFGCHAAAKCAACHASRPEDSFAHGKSSGWPLNRFHRRLACAACHGAGEAFKVPASGCDSCHPGWQKGFDHSRTGLKLSEVHASLGCEACHADGRFAAPPAFAACHQDKRYPADRPGTAAAAGR